MDVCVWQVYSIAAAFNAPYFGGRPKQTESPTPESLAIDIGFSIARPRIYLSASRLLHFCSIFVCERRSRKKNFVYTLGLGSFWAKFVKFLENSSARRVVVGPKKGAFFLRRFTHFWHSSNNVKEKFEWNLGPIYPYYTRYTIRTTRSSRFHKLSKVFSTPLLLIPSISPSITSLFLPGLLCVRQPLVKKKSTFAVATEREREKIAHTHAFAHRTQSSL